MSSLQGLTARQYEILSHVAQGKSHAQIEADLHISVSTINGAMTNIVEKLDTPDGYKPRAYAVALWWQNEAKLIHTRSLELLCETLKTVYVNLSGEDIN